MLQGRVKYPKEAEVQDNVSWAKGVRSADIATLGGFTLYRCKNEGEEPRPGHYNILFSQRAYREVERHLKEDTSREHGGLLLGYETGIGGPATPTVIVTHALRANDASGTPTSLTFDEKTWAEWDRMTEDVKRVGIDLQRVGWYHSHPNIQIFLSRYDVDVCTTFNRLKCPVALVVDPVNDKGGFFTRGPEGYDTHSPKDFWELHPEEEAGVSWVNLQRALPPVEGTALGLDQLVPHQPGGVVPNRKAAATPDGNDWTRRALPVVLLGVVVALLGSVFTLGLLVSRVGRQQSEIAGMASQLSAVQEQLKQHATAPPITVPGEASAPAKKDEADSKSSAGTKKAAEAVKKSEKADTRKADTKKDATKKNDDKKAIEKKDNVQKNDAKNDEANKDDVKKDETKKDEVKDEAKKDEAKKDEAKKDETKKQLNQEPAQL